jgi:hypothetical protein
MSLELNPPEELARRVERLAAERQVSPEQVVIEAIEAQLGPRRRLSFSGVGSSGPSDATRRRREIATEAMGRTSESAEEH